jgi:hypothetical protein
MSLEYLVKGDGLELSKSLIESNLLGFLAVDKASLCKCMGDNFHLEYLKIKEFRNYKNFILLYIYIYI